MKGAREAALDATAFLVRSCNVLLVMLYSTCYEQASAKADLSRKSNGFVAIRAASLFNLHRSA